MEFFFFFSMSDLTTTLHMLMIYFQAAYDAKNIPSTSALLFIYGFIYLHCHTCDVYINVQHCNTSKSIIIDMGVQCFPFSLSAFIYVYIYLFLSRNKYEAASKAMLLFIYTYLHHNVVVIPNVHLWTGSLKRELLNISYAV